MPYKIIQSGSGYKVAKKDGSKVFSKEPLTLEGAKKQLAAIHINSTEGTEKSGDSMNTKIAEMLAKLAAETEKSALFGRGRRPYLFNGAIRNRIAARRGGGGSYQPQQAAPAAPQSSLAGLSTEPSGLGADAGSYGGADRMPEADGPDSPTAVAARSPQSTFQPSQALTAGGNPFAPKPFEPSQSLTAGGNPFAGSSPSSFQPSQTLTAGGNPFAPKPFEPSQTLTAGGNPFAPSSVAQDWQISGPEPTKPQSWQAPNSADAFFASKMNSPAPAPRPAAVAKAPAPPLAGIRTGPGAGDHAMALQGSANDRALAAKNHLNAFNRNQAAKAPIVGPLPSIGKPSAMPGLAKSSNYALQPIHDAASALPESVQPAALMGMYGGLGGAGLGAGAAAVNRDPGAIVRGGLRGAGAGIGAGLGGRLSGMLMNPGNHPGNNALIGLLGTLAGGGAGYMGGDYLGELATGKKKEKEKTAQQLFYSTMCKAAASIQKRAAGDQDFPSSADVNAQMHTASILGNGVTGGMAGAALGAGAGALKHYFMDSEEDKKKNGLLKKLLMGGGMGAVAGGVGGGVVGHLKPDTLSTGEAAVIDSARALNKVQNSLPAWLGGGQ